MFQDIMDLIKGRDITILAPHPDDEVIGCYSLLDVWNSGTVVYFAWNPQRKAEAIKSGEEIGHNTVFSSLDDPGIKGSDVLLVPSIADNHPLHQAVNHLSYTMKANTRVFYSTEKNISFEPLPEEMVERKTKHLNLFYPSQRGLWDRDQKYVLFEGFRTKDYETFAMVSFRFEGFHQWVDIPSSHTEQYLKDVHRHLFHCRVWVEQFHEDRDVEYIEVKRAIKTFAEDFSRNNLIGSCEMFADVLRVFVKTHYRGRRVKVEVVEDGENGAFIE